MKELEMTFTGTSEVRGFVFMQLKASDKAYLYQVTVESQIHYEVFERKENTRFNCISYPKRNAFGVWAWCIRDHAKACQKYDFLTQKTAIQ